MESVKCIQYQTTELCNSKRVAVNNGDAQAKINAQSLVTKTLN